MVNTKHLHLIELNKILFKNVLMEELTEFIILIPNLEIYNAFTTFVSEK